MSRTTSKYLAGIAGTAAAVVLVCAGALLLQRYIGEPLDKLLLHLPGIDKPMHFGGFVVMFFVVERLLRRTMTDVRLRILTALSVGVALAAGDEALQSWLPRRNVEIADLAADWCGLVAGAAVFWPGPLGRRQVAAAAAVALAGWIAWESHVTTRDYAAGVLAESRREYAVARRHYLKALDAGARTASLYNGLGWVEIESGEGDPAKAVEYASLAMSMRGEDADVLDTYGWALLHAGRTTEALPPLLKAFAKKPQMYCIHYHLGQTYRRLGRIADARKEFELQLARTPAGPDAMLARAALDDLESAGH